MCTAYSMSKHGINAFSNGLRKEVKRFGIKVIKIEPGMFKTNIYHEIKLRIARLWKTTNDEVRNAYGINYDQELLQLLEEFYHTEYDKTLDAVDSIFEAITVDEPKIVYTPAGFLQRIYILLLNYAPLELQDIFMNHDFFNIIQFYRFDLRKFINVFK